MNVEEVKQRGPILPLDWGHFTYCKYSDRHPNCSVTERDILIFMVGHFPREIIAFP